MHRQENIRPIIEFDNFRRIAVDMRQVYVFDGEAREQEVVDEVEGQLLSRLQDQPHARDRCQVGRAGTVGREVVPRVLLLRQEPLAARTVLVSNCFSGIDSTNLSQLVM